MRVRFLQRHGAHWPGADPILCEPELSQLLNAGICEPFDKPKAAPAPVAPVVETVDEPTEVEAEAPTLPVAEPENHPLRRGRRK